MRGGPRRGGDSAAPAPPSSPGSSLKDKTCCRSQRFPPESETVVPCSPGHRGRDRTCITSAASSRDSSASSAWPAQTALPGQAAESVPRPRRAGRSPTPSPTSSRSTSPTSPPARATASAAPTGPSTGLRTGRCTGRCRSPRPHAVLAGAERTATHSAVTELSAGCCARTVGPAPSPADAPARPAGWGEPARQTWTNVPARATAAGSSASTRLAATTVPAGMASASLPMTRCASRWCQPPSQKPSAKQVPSVK
ncbi:epidermal growth factor-like protein 7 isoform X2 [Caloenas nicobarica]|uniref:epidermal growth factor-like protein 7 isoform X2 n=1 Tax=Caloenas nicobarica TaxID=187106 RepID=UPI0032B7C941